MTTSRRKSKVKAKKRKVSNGFLARNRMAIIIVTSIVIALIVGVAIFSLPSYSGEAVSVVIPAGSTADDVADTLESKLGSNLGKRVYLLWKLQGGNPSKAMGYYAVVDGNSAGRISRRLATGAQSPVKISFNAVRSIDRLASVLTHNLEITPEDFLKACDKILVDRGLTKEQFPAAFIPDTYEFYYTTSAENLVKRLFAYRNRYWTVDRVKRAEELGLTPVDVATIASIVEEETAKIDERSTVARLYMNRLAKGMKLQADPTVKFAIGDETIRRITGAMLKTPSAYNTYLHEGLPPGPIRVPERSTLEAVLNAPLNDYIYMCAREDFSGYHNFTNSYAEHQKNAARYQSELNRRGIK